MEDFSGQIIVMNMRLCAHVSVALSVIIDTDRQYLSQMWQQHKHDNGISYGLCVLGCCKWIFFCDKGKR